MVYDNYISYIMSNFKRAYVYFYYNTIKLNIKFFKFEWCIETLFEFVRLMFQARSFIFFVKFKIHSYLNCLIYIIFFNNSNIVQIQII